MRSTSDVRKMFRYFRSTRPGPRRGRAASDGFMPHLPLLEDAGDDLVQRRVLDADVGDGVAVEDGAEHLGDAGAVHLEGDDRPLAAGDLAVAPQVVRRRLGE